MHVNFVVLPGPGGGMADAEDLKSSGDFSSCGFDSHPGHQYLFERLSGNFFREFSEDPTPVQNFPYCIERR